MDGQNQSRTSGELKLPEHQVELLLQSVRSLEQSVARQQTENERLQTENERLQTEHAQLREDLRECRVELQQYKDRYGPPPTERLDEAYSLRSEEQRQQERAGSKRRRKQKSPRRGRRTTAEKMATADREEDVFPADVPADETGWSLNSVWALFSENARVFLFGVPKDARTLWTLLPKELFNGVLVSDDAAVYRDFNTAQKLLGSSAAQGHPAHTAAAGERRIPPVLRRPARALPQGLPTED